MAVVKQASIQTPSGFDTRDIGAEAQNIEVSRNGSGEIIEDITASGVIVDSTEGLSRTLKNLENNKQNKLTFDASPTNGSTNPVTSGGVYTAIQADNSLSTTSQKAVQNKVVTSNLNQKVAKYNNDTTQWDTTPTSGSTKPVTSGGVYTAITKTQAMIAQPFDKNKTGGYKVDDVVTYADKLYKFTSAHSGAWTGLDVEQVDVEQQVTEMKQSFQGGVDTIYDAITGRGVQPSGSTPSDCAAAINTMYSPESYTNYGTNQYNAGRSQGRTDVGGTFQAGQIFSVSGAFSISYSVEANHYYLFIGTATSDTTGITINSGATLVGQYSTKNNAQNNMIAIVALVKTTSTTVALHLTSGMRGVIATVKLGLCS